MSNMGYASGASIPGPAKNLYKTQVNQFLVLPLLHRWQATRRCARTPCAVEFVLVSNCYKSRCSSNMGPKQVQRRAREPQGAMGMLRNVLERQIFLCVEAPSRALKEQGSSFHGLTSSTFVLANKPAHLRDSSSHRGLP